jgi:hypothetical protein
MSAGRHANSAKDGLTGQNEDCVTFRRTSGRDRHVELGTAHGACSPVSRMRSRAVSIYASHEGISFELIETRPGEWSWTFLPPAGARRTGRVVGDQQWAFTVVRRAIEVWHLMNRTDRNAA